jgi:hypothetical protein
MEQSPLLKQLIDKLCLDILAQVDQGMITLGFLEKSLTTFAETVRGLTDGRP